VGRYQATVAKAQAEFVFELGRIQLTLAQDVAAAATRTASH
jgi:hypothetical protein